MDGETRGDTDLLDSTWFDTILPPEAVECLLPPEPEEEPDTLGALLAYACDVGSLENVQSLLRQGAIPSRSFHNGKSAIEWATLKQHKEILACLKEHIPNIDTQQNEQPKMKRTKLKPPPPNMQPHNTIDLVDDEPMEETRRRKIPPRQAPPTTLLSTTSRTSSTSSSSTRQPQTKRRDVLSLYHYERRPVDPRSKSKPRHDDATTTSKLSDGSRSKSNPRKSNKPLESDDLGVISVPPVDNNPFVDIQDKSNPQLHTEKKSRDIPRGHEESFRHEKSVARRTRERSRSSSRSPPRNHPWHPSMDMIILFVGNLSKSATENEVRDLFSKCGVIQYFNRGINHAHITFAKVEEAIDALGLNDHVFHGKPLRISVGERSNRKLAREVKQRLRERVDSMPEPLPKRKRSRSRSPEKWKHDKYEERESKRRLDRSSSPTRSKSHHRESRSSKSHYRDSDSRSRAIVATILRVDIDLEKVIRAAHHQDPKEAVDTIITTEIDQNTDEETNMKIESGIVRKAGAEEAKTSHRAREVYFVHQVDITAEAADMMLWISVLRRHHGQRD
ncbi:hypothetical protein AeRB84_014688 [Aphanomyces euteiches]|nr:hypothetical protein AeRB84_014688 [Aphanomyces euteiches]